MAEPLIKNEVAAHHARNEKLLQLIEERGGDFDELRPIDFFFYAESQEAAFALAGDLKGAGFHAVRVSAQRRDGKWCIEAVSTDSAVGGTAEDFIEQLVTLSSKYCAKFDGWGTSI